MNALHAIILGVVEGLTEFLPISSTGHLIITSHFLKLVQGDFLKTFEIAIQVGAISAVLFVFTKKILTNYDLAFKTALAFIPTGIIGLLTYSYAKKYLLGNIEVVIWSLLVGGIIIILTELYLRKKEPLPVETEDTSVISWKSALLIGVFQSIAVIPGVSRSGATIIGGLWLGISRKKIVEFSFLLALPTLVAATGLSLIKTSGGFNSDQWLLLFLGSVASFITAILSIKFFLRYVEKHSFLYFGVYRIILALVLFSVIL